MTLQFHAPIEIQRPGYVFSSLKRHLPDALVEEAKRMSLTADGRCAVFDVPAANVKARAPGLPLLRGCSVCHFLHGCVGECPMLEPFM